MRFRLLLVLALGLSGGTASEGADADWAGLRAGMTPAQVAGIVGTAVQSNTGRGFVVGIYDRQAEVVYYRGRLMSWTPPKALATTQSAAAGPAAVAATTPPICSVAGQAAVVPPREGAPLRLPTGGAVTRELEAALDVMKMNHKNVATSAKPAKAGRSRE